jgi:hypothetical protein
VSTTIDDLKQWFAEGKERGATHMIVATDTFDWSDYPVYVMPGDDVGVELTKRNGQNMTKVMEVYSFTKDFDKQKSNGRLCWDLD